MFSLSSCGGSSGGGSNKTNQAPIARFTVTPTIERPLYEFIFDASNSSDSDGFIEQYTWEFGNGETGLGLSPAHRFRSKGTGIFPIGTNIETDGNNTVFVALEDMDGDGDLDLVEANAGGMSGSPANFNRIYLNDGTFRATVVVTLTVTDNDGAIGIATNNISVGPK